MQDGEIRHIDRVGRFARVDLSVGEYENVYVVSIEKSVVCSVNADCKTRAARSLIIRLFKFNLNRCRSLVYLKGTVFAQSKVIVAAEVSVRLVCNRETRHGNGIGRSPNVDLSVSSYKYARNVALEKSAESLIGAHILCCAIGNCGFIVYSVKLNLYGCLSFVYLKSTVRRKDDIIVSADVFAFVLNGKVGKNERVRAIACGNLIGCADVYVNLIPKKESASLALDLGGSTFTFRALIVYLFKFNLNGCLSSVNRENSRLDEDRIVFGALDAFPVKDLYIYVVCDLSFVNVGYRNG